MQYLIDTDILIHHLHGKFSLGKKFDEIGYANCYVSEITIAELAFGAEYSSNRDKHIAEVDAAEQTFSILPITEAVRTYAVIKATLRRSGSLIPDNDLFVGATALHHDLTLATANTKHFTRIDKLRIEDWTKKEFNRFI